MNDFQQYIPLSQCAAYALDEDKGEDIDRYWLLSFRAYVDIVGRVTNEPKSVRLPVLDNNTVMFPSDYIKWTKVGVMGSDGKVVTLAFNKSISTFRSTNPSRLDKLSADVQSPMSTDLYYLNFFDGQNYTHLGCNNAQLLQPGEFNIDEKNNLIVLPPSFAFADIVLEYTSSPEKDKDYQIEQCCQEAVIAFIRWKAKTGSEIDYYNRLREARRALAPIRLQVVNEIIRYGKGWKIHA